MASAFIFESPIVKPLNNSNTAAIVASVGIHALVLGVALPYLAATSSKEKSDLSDVQLIELSPADQSRLPNLSGSTPDITQFTTPSLGDNPLAETPTVDPNQLPPSIESFSSIQTPPSLPSLPPLEGMRSTPSLPPLPSLPRMNIYNPPVASLPNTRTNYLPEPTTQLQPPQRYEQPETPFREENLRPDFGPTEDTNVDIRNAPIDQGWRRQQELDQQPQQTALANPRTLDPRLEEERQRQLRDDMLARARQLQESTQFNSSNTSSEEARRNYVSWLNQDQVKKKTIKPEAVAIEGNYPTWVSQTGRQLQGTAEFGVILDASGNPVDVTLLQSSGYPALDEQAKKDILAQISQRARGANQPYRVSVTFKPPAQPVERNIAQPENNQRPTPPSRETTPNTPAVQPSSQPVQPPSQPANKQPETQITQPANPQNNQQPPVVEKAPTPEAKPETQPTQPAQQQQESPTPPVVEQPPAPENVKPETVSEPKAPPANSPSPTVAEPPAGPATQKPDPAPASTPSTTQKPPQAPEPLGSMAPKKAPTPTPEAQNTTSNTPSGT